MLHELSLMGGFREALEDMLSELVHAVNQQAWRLAAVLQACAAKGPMISTLGGLKLHKRVEENITTTGREGKNWDVHYELHGRLQKMAVH